MIRPFLLALLLAAGVPALAGARDGAGQLPCNPEGSQVELNACAANELAAADAELNATWREVLKRLGDDAVAVDRLKTAQRLWIQLRDADLEAQFPLAEGQDPRMQYGSMYPMSFASAKAELTRQRTGYLRAQFLADVPY
ncbi:DUF1311 domain-containing protein [Flavobacterium sp. MXW15]|uniref:DUF1311 domain-containing protein n=1 Tax=Xanthomonas chitinilytica TaxID=2989819 RepID=A0ABT3JUQ8_9XANT|nr:DUF1311 domain-containing protein [Xanthomonas sp. H13-6]MCW4453446.1 DUF1311 domain-containing protein [Flavobacterium sp. MXW15]MCW4472201.1 DUF1311 domain-containing protein [Xanthomonas sp. H13-6]